MNRTRGTDALPSSLTTRRSPPIEGPDLDCNAAITPERWAVYLIECMDGRVYTGIARDPEQRYAKHVCGKGARFTRSNPPRRLLGWTWVDGHGTALRLEMAWKQMPREQRIAALQASMGAL